MKRYTPHVPPYSGNANFEEDDNGKWVKYEELANEVTDFEKAIYMLSILKIDADIVPVYKGEGEIEVHIYFSDGGFYFNTKGDLLIKEVE